MYELISTYGNAAILAIVAILTTLMAKHVVAKIDNETAKGIVSRAIDELFAAVSEVGQTWVDGIKRGREDGVLTDDEKLRARSEAIAIAKSNIGAKGLKRLMRILGADVDVDKWLGNKVETLVDARKRTTANPLKA